MFENKIYLGFIDSDSIKRVPKFDIENAANTSQTSSSDHVELCGLQRNLIKFNGIFSIFFLDLGDLH